MSTRKTVLITGSSRGIGFLTAKELVRRGHHVIASMRNPTVRNAKPAKELSAFSDEHPGDVQIVDLDVTEEESVLNAICGIDQERPIDVLINNVGVMPVGPTEAFTTQQLQEFFDINFMSIVRTMRAVLSLMRKRDSGLIINMSSSAGRVAIPHFGVYCATKWAMEGYSESLNYELEGTGVHCVLVEPSGHKTDLVSTSPAPEDIECTESYGAVANGGQRLLDMFHDAFAAKDPINDAQNVADKLADLVDMKSVPPLRTVVGADMGVQSINDAVHPYQSELIESLKPVYEV